MHMGTKRNMYKHAYKMYDHVLETVENHQYLGIYISHNLKWDYHFECVSKKARRVLGILQRNLRQCSVQTKQAAYYGLVRPLLEYAVGCYRSIYKRMSKNLTKSKGMQLDFAQIIITGGTVSLKLWTNLNGTHYHSAEKPPD